MSYIKVALPKFYIYFFFLNNSWNDYKSFVAADKLQLLVTVNLHTSLLQEFMGSWHLERTRGLTF